MKPTVMISSTYSDLKDIRHVVHGFIANDLGYNCLISEHHDFPVNSTETAIDNCRRAVKKDSDILVLIIDKRFGSVDSESGHSITSIEYFEARQKKIPIIAFISKQVLSYYDVWKSNPSNHFEGLVDSNELFEFIDAVNTKDKVWTYKFDNLDEIIVPIRSQLANMFADLLPSCKMVGLRRGSINGGITLHDALEKIYRQDRSLGAYSREQFESTGLHIAFSVQLQETGTGYYFRIVSNWRRSFLIVSLDLLSQSGLILLISG